MMINKLTDEQIQIIKDNAFTDDVREALYRYIQKKYTKQDLIVLNEVLDKYAYDNM